jgi:hypothetical protein
MMGALSLWQWWKGSEWVGGCGWRFGVCLRLDGDADRIIWVASSGLFFSLEHGGH